MKILANVNQWRCSICHFMIAGPKPEACPNCGAKSANIAEGVTG